MNDFFPLFNEVFHNILSSNLFLFGMQLLITTSIVVLIQKLFKIFL